MVYSGISRIIYNDSTNSAQCRNKLLTFNNKYFLKIIEIKVGEN